MNAADIARRRLELVMKTGYPLEQMNYRTRFGPPDNWSGHPPSRDCEIFVGKIPQYFFEDDMVRLFSVIGKIYEIHFMRDFNGTNCGFAFVRFTNTIDAKVAIQRLNGYEIQPGNRIVVEKSVEQRQLFISNLPCDASIKEIRSNIRQAFDGVKKVMVPPSTNKLYLNDGYAFVEFSDHKAAARAKIGIMRHKISLWGRNNIRVAWTEWRYFNEQKISEKWCLYFGNMKYKFDKHQFHKWVTADPAVEVTSIRHLRGYSFVNYRTKNDAEIALKKLQGDDSSYFGFKEKPLIIRCDKAHVVRSQSNGTGHGFNY